jgi:MFS family permease
LAPELSAFAAIKAPGLRLLAAAFTLFKTSEMGSWLAVTAVAHEFGGVREASIVMVASLLPAAGFAPFVGPLASRHGVGTVLRAGLLVQTVCLVGIAALGVAESPKLTIYFLVIVGTTAMVTTRPTIAAALPGAVDDPRQLTAAHAVLGSLDGVATLCGPALTAIVVTVAGMWAPFALFGVMTASAAVLASAGPLRHGIEADDEDPSLSEAPVRLVDGARAVFGTIGIRPVLVMLATGAFAAGAVDLLFVVVGVDVIGGTTADAGWLSAAFGAGTLVGGAIGFVVVGPRRLWPPVVASGIAAAVGLAIVSVADGSFAAAGFVVAGLAGALLVVSARAMLQRLADLDVVCHAFALAESADMMMLLIGTASVPLFVTVFSPEAASAAVALVVAAAVVGTARALRRGEHRVPMPIQLIAQLRASPVLGLLPPGSLELLARAARPVAVAAGTAVVQEGEVGELYYVVTHGRLQVTIDGRPIRILESGAGFGETALLHTTTRTATVTAIDDVELLTVERAPFVFTVSGHAPAMEVSRVYLDPDQLPD